MTDATSSNRIFSVIPIVLAGGAIASIPWFLLMLLPGASHAEVGNCVTIVNGRTTWCGYIEGFKLLAEIFTFGAFGGLMFWFCVVWRAGDKQSVADV